MMMTYVPQTSIDMVCGNRLGRLNLIFQQTIQHTTAEADGASLGPACVPRTLSLGVMNLEIAEGAAWCLPTNAYGWIAQTNR